MSDSPLPLSDITTFGQRLRWLVEVKMRESQAAFARRIGVRPPMLSRWITGVFEPSSTNLERIIEATGVAEAWLRMGVGQPFEEERPEDAVYDPAEGAEKYDPTAETAEMLFGQLEKWIRGMGGEGDMAQAKLRRLDALEGLRRFFSARGPVPDWWYDIKRKVEDGEL